MNYRSKLILATLEKVSGHYHDEPINVIEVGCMFREIEGLSTYIVADFLEKRPQNGVFYSIEYDKNHIDAAKNILAKYNDHLIQKVNFIEGHSIKKLPEILREIGVVHFVVLDGGAHPEVCLSEFEMVVDHLAEYGCVIEDDAHLIGPSDNYPFPRIFGKATLILPMLVLKEYIGIRTAVRKANSDSDDLLSVPESKFIQDISKIKILSEKDYDFVLSGNKQMLVFGKRDLIKDIIEGIKIQKRTIPQLLISIFKRFWNRCIGR